MDNSGIKKTVFLCESRICVIAGMYVYDSGVFHHLRCGILQPVSIRYDGSTRFTVLFAVCFKFSLCDIGYAACFAYHRTVIAMMVIGIMLHFRQSAPAAVNYSCGGFNTPTIAS